jgi:hypothetical protein
LVISVNKLASLNEDLRLALTLLSLFEKQIRFLNRDTYFLFFSFLRYSLQSRKKESQVCKNQNPQRNQKTLATEHRGKK